ncbi:hypothetical protein N0B21_20375 [Bacillus velezensis]|uniref:hypothetical protein n=1 Tax=Bacillus velezensis TaxID=492670 RepID=UPI0021B0A93B|nr:hypothetical protein [Bacillus velezensis]MCT6684539.1 hypothetical protein [Bacillus velezensis]
MTEVSHNEWMDMVENLNHILKNKNKFHHTYRNELILLNTIDNNGKWIIDFNGRFEYANSINEAKNKIDQNLGGFATAKKPKRFIEFERKSNSYTEWGD